MYGNQNTTPQKNFNDIANDIWEQLYQLTEKEILDPIFSTLFFRFLSSNTDKKKNELLLKNIKKLILIISDGTLEAKSKKSIFGYILTRGWENVYLSTGDISKKYFQLKLCSESLFKNQEDVGEAINQFFSLSPSDRIKININYFLATIRIMRDKGWSKKQIEMLLFKLKELKYLPASIILKNNLQALYLQSWTTPQILSFFMKLLREDKFILLNVPTTLLINKTNISKKELQDKIDNLHAVSEISYFIRKKVLEPYILLNFGKIEADLDELKALNGRDSPFDFSFYYNAIIKKDSFKSLPLEIKFKIVKRLARFIKLNSWQSSWHHNFNIIDGYFEYELSHRMNHPCLQRLVGKYGLYLSKLILKNGAHFKRNLDHIAKGARKDVLPSQDFAVIYKKYGYEFILNLQNIISPFCLSFRPIVYQPGQSDIKPLCISDFRSHIAPSYSQVIHYSAVPKGSLRTDYENEYLVYEKNFIVKHLSQPIKHIKRAVRQITTREEWVRIIQYRLKTGGEIGAIDPILTKFFSYLFSNSKRIRKIISDINVEHYDYIYAFQNLLKGDIQKSLLNTLRYIPDEVIVNYRPEEFFSESNYNKEEIILYLNGYAENLDPESPKNKYFIFADLAERIFSYSKIDLRKDILTNCEMKDSTRHIVDEIFKNPAEAKRLIILKMLLKALIRQFHHIDITFRLKLLRKFKTKKYFSHHYSLKIVKGSFFQNWGLSVDVCIADDENLWENENFKLISVYDKTQQFIVGYVHAFDVVINYKKYMTLPGINFNPLFFDNATNGDFVLTCLENIKKLAYISGYEGIYIPKYDHILGNSLGIEKVVKNMELPIKKIPIVHWNTKPKPYPFSKVYVLWEK